MSHGFHNNGTRLRTKRIAGYTPTGFTVSEITDADRERAKFVARCEAIHDKTCHTCGKTAIYKWNGYGACSQHRSDIMLLKPAPEYAKAVKAISRIQ